MSPEDCCSQQQSGGIEQRKLGLWQCPPLTYKVPQPHRQPEPLHLHGLQEPKGNCFYTLSLSLSLKCVELHKGHSGFLVLNSSNSITPLQVNQRNTETTKWFKTFPMNYFSQSAKHEKNVDKRWFNFLKTRNHWRCSFPLLYLLGLHLYRRQILIPLANKRSTKSQLDSIPEPWLHSLLQPI